LLTLTIDQVNYSILFLHTKSGSEPLGLGLRDDMLRRALEFKGVLESAPTASVPANYMFLGDLNTMGMEYTYLRDRDIGATQEIEKMKLFAEGRDMRLLVKDEPFTWWNGPGHADPPSNLDQVVVADHMVLKQTGGADVEVFGWPKEPTDAAKAKWISEFSDHGCLVMEVQKV
jgi:hypothetical protein